MPCASIWRRPQAPAPAERGSTILQTTRHVPRIKQVLLPCRSGGGVPRERGAFGAVLGVAGGDARGVLGRSGGVCRPAAAERARAAALREDGQDGQHHRPPLGALP